MKIIKHPSCTHDLGAPSDMRDGSCSALPVRYDETEHGTFAVSFWQPESEDLALLAAGGVVTLHVRAPGRQHPVVMVSAQLDNPSADFGDVFGQLQEANRQMGAMLALSEIREKVVDLLRDQTRDAERMLGVFQEREKTGQRMIKERDEQIATLRAEVAHLSRAIALADELRNKERGFPVKFSDDQGKDESK